MIPLSPIPLGAADKLEALQRVDIYRPWHALSEKRLCLQCGHIVTGRELAIVGGTRGLGPLRLQCPTPGCPATAMDMALPQSGVNSPRERWHQDGDRMVSEAPAHATIETGRRKAFAKLWRVLHRRDGEKVN
jgi:hypothetical protein